MWAAGLRGEAVRRTVRYCDKPGLVAEMVGQLAAQFPACERLLTSESTNPLPHPRWAFWQPVVSLDHSSQRMEEWQERWHALRGMTDVLLKAVWVRVCERLTEPPGFLGSTWDTVWMTVPEAEVSGLTDVSKVELEFGQWVAAEQLGALNRVDRLRVNVTATDTLP